MRVLRLLDRANEKLRRDGLIPVLSASAYFVGRHVDRRLRPVIRRILYRIRYGSTAPAPQKLIRVNPGDVEYLIVPKFSKQVSRQSTLVKAGAWDRAFSEQCVLISSKGVHEGITNPTLIDFDNYIFYTSAKEHFCQGVPWTETAAFQQLANEGMSWSDRYATKEATLQTFKEVDRLYENINKHGYKTQVELMEQDDLQFDSENIRTAQGPFHEVAVNIGREGELFFDDGRHRFVVAKVLGLDAIPVRVAVRHTEWQSLRQEIGNASSIAELSPRAKVHDDHPDMEDVRPDLTGPDKI